MKTRTERTARWSLFLILALALALVSHLCVIKDIAAAADKAAGPAACLPCHGGSFDKLADKKPSFKADGGLVNPHQFIPHNEKKAENVPSCTDCHTVHPNPPKGKIDLSKVNIESCYLGCHHTQNFERCETCHKKEKKAQ